MAYQLAGTYLSQSVSPPRNDGQYHNDISKPPVMYHTSYDSACNITLPSTLTPSGTIGRQGDHSCEFTTALIRHAARQLGVDYVPSTDTTSIYSDTRLRSTMGKDVSPQFALDVDVSPSQRPQFQPNTSLDSRERLFKNYQQILTEYTGVEFEDDVSLPDDHWICDIIDADMRYLSGEGNGGQYNIPNELQKEISLREKALGHDHLSVAKLRVLLGEYYFRVHKERCNRKNRVLNNKLVTDSATVSWDSYSMKMDKDEIVTDSLPLSSAYITEECYEAEEQFELALEIFKKRYGGERAKEVIPLMAKIGTYYASCCQYEKAALYFEKCNFSAEAEKGTKENRHLFLKMTKNREEKKLHASDRLRSLLGALRVGISASEANIKVNRISSKNKNETSRSPVSRSSDALFPTVTVHEGNLLSFQQDELLQYYDGVAVIPEKFPKVKKHKSTDYGPSTDKEVIANALANTVVVSATSDILRRRQRDIDEAVEKRLKEEREKMIFKRYNDNCEKEVTRGHINKSYLMSDVERLALRKPAAMHSRNSLQKLLEASKIDDNKKYRNIINIDKGDIHCWQSTPDIGDTEPLTHDGTVSVAPRCDDFTNIGNIMVRSQNSDDIASSTLAVVKAAMKKAALMRENRLKTEMEVRRGCTDKYYSPSPFRDRASVQCVAESHIVTDGHSDRVSSNPYQCCVELNLDNAHISQVEEPFFGAPLAITGNTRGMVGSSFEVYGRGGVTGVCDNDTGGDPPVSSVVTSHHNNRPSSNVSVVPIADQIFKGDDNITKNNTIPYCEAGIGRRPPQQKRQCPTFEARHCVDTSNFNNYNIDSQEEDDIDIDLYRQIHQKQKQERENSYTIDP